MSQEILVGDRVKLLGVPDWLVHDLPGDEQAEIRSFVGFSTIVEDIDKYGYYWIGFGATCDVGDAAR